MTSKVSRLASTIPWSGIQTFPVYFCHLGSLWYLRLLCYVSLTVMLLVPLVLTIVSPVRCLTMLWPSSKGSQQSKCTQWNFMFILYRTWSVHLFMLCRPFGRLWWDEIVPTVVTRAEPHNQVKTIRIPLYIYSTKPVFFFGDWAWMIFCRLFCIPVKLEFWPSVKMQGCKVFLIITGCLAQ